MSARQMSDDEDKEIALRMHEILEPLDPFDRIRLSGLTFALVGTAADLDDERLLAMIRHHLALIRKWQRTSDN